MQPDYLASVRLKDRGWTSGMIKKFLATPDRLEPNPHFKSRPPMRLYLKTRVEQIESSEDFRRVQLLSTQRKSGVRKAIETKRLKTANRVASIRFTVPKLPKSALMRLAAEHHASIGGVVDDDPRHDDRIAVAYLCQCLTGYAAELDAAKGHVGAKSAAREIKRAALVTIAEAYPYLRDECVSQGFDDD